MGRGEGAGDVLQDTVWILGREERVPGGSDQGRCAAELLLGRDAEGEMRSGFFSWDEEDY